MIKLFYGLIWRLSEWSGIGLGEFAPYVFHQMLGKEKTMKRIR